MKFEARGHHVAILLLPELGCAVGDRGHVSHEDGATPSVVPSTVIKRCQILFYVNRVDCKSTLVCFFLFFSHHQMNYLITPFNMDI